MKALRKRDARNADALSFARVSVGARYISVG